jgi:uncharacterized protein YdhG (YjbR/CyaY superfamily)
MGRMATFTSIDDYVASFPDGPREILEQVRDAMRRGAPGSQEKIRYGMPALMFRDRYGVHFAGWKKHVGLYPVATFEGDLEHEIAPYRATKDTVQFFYDKPVPYDLIERVTRELASRHAG